MCRLSTKDHRKLKFYAFTLPDMPYSTTVIVVGL
jgi:hypothetical protein